MMEVIVRKPNWYDHTITYLKDSKIDAETPEEAKIFNSIGDAVTAARKADFFAYKTCRYLVLDKPDETLPPLPGDAVITSCRRYMGGINAERTEVTGILDGMVGEARGEYLVTFNYSSFRDRSVSSSGGPAPYIYTKDLERVGTKEVFFWQWEDGFAGAHRGIYYRLEVPLWRWKRDKAECDGCYYKNRGECPGPD